MTNETDSGPWAEFNCFEKIIKLNGKSFAHHLNRFISPPFICWADEDSTVVLDLQAIFKKDEILSWSLKSMNEDDHMFRSIFHVLLRNNLL